MKTGRKPLGYDFAGAPLEMVVGAMTFIEQLGQANIVAIGYGESQHRAVAGVIPTINLVGTNAEALASAFKEFDRWGADEDGDAVDVAIVLVNSGGYRVVISPEPRRALIRLRGYDRGHRRLSLTGSYIKQFDTTSPALLELKRYIAGFPSPVLIDGAWLSTLAPSPAVVDIRPIDGVSPLLKFELTIIDEAAVSPDSRSAVALAFDRESSNPTPKPQRASRLPRLEDVADSRAHALRTHFPMTLERLRQCDWLSGEAQNLMERGIEPWQIEQAACNLVLSQELTGQPHYGGFAPRLFEDRLFEAVSSRYEKADGGSITPQDAPTLGTQILADGAQLLRAAGRKGRVTDLASLQRILAKHDLLVGHTAVVDLP